MDFTIIGTGSAVPSHVETNHDLSKFIDTTDEWIFSRSGIKERHICTDDTLIDIAYKAAIAALNNANVLAEDLDLIICATASGEYIIPSLACLLQERLHATCPAFDLNAACSGFIYALDVAAGYYARGTVKKVLIVAADALSRFVDWTDRSTCVLFGDAAGAAVLAEGNDLLSIRLTASGNGDVLNVPNIQGNFPKKIKNSSEPYLKMVGQEIYKFAIFAMCNDIKTVIEAAGIKKKEISFVLPHQANIRIIEAALSRLSIPNEKCLTNIQNYGNTSAASIPLVLDEANRNGTFKSGDILVLSAFGGGLTTGACVIRWNKTN